MISVAWITKNVRLLFFAELTAKIGSVFQSNAIFFERNVLKGIARKCRDSVPWLGKNAILPERMSPTAGLCGTRLVVF